MKKIVLRISVILILIAAGALVSFAQSTKLETNKAAVNFTLKASETKLWNVDLKKKQPICFEVNVDSKGFVLLLNHSRLLPIKVT